MEEGRQEIELPSPACEKPVGNDGGSSGVKCYGKEPLPEAKNCLEAKCLDPAPVPAHGEYAVQYPLCLKYAESGPGYRPDGEGCPGILWASQPEINQWRQKLCPFLNQPGEKDIGYERCQHGIAMEGFYAEEMGHSLVGPGLKRVLNKGDGGGGENGACDEYRNYTSDVEWYS